MFGFHIDSNTNNILDNAKYVKKTKCNMLQLFVDPMKKKNIYDNFSKYLKANNIECVVHASYTINCARDWNDYSWWIKRFILEIEYAEIINAFAIVIHLGKQLDLSQEESYNNMYTSLLHVHNKTKNSNVKILLETSSGQGSELCYKIENLAYFYNKLSKHKNENIRNRFGICVDTCHIYVSGHDIRSLNAINKYLDTFNKLIGLEHIKLIHLNDSKQDIGTKIDRHENIGKGYIGKKGLLIFISIFKHLEVPIILETPKNYLEQDIKIISSEHSFQKLL